MHFFLFFEVNRAQGYQQERSTKRFILYTLLSKCPLTGIKYESKANWHTI